VCIPPIRVAQKFEAQIAAAGALEDPMASLVAFSQVVRVPIGLLQPMPDLDQMRAMGEGFQTMRPPATAEFTAALGAFLTKH
jgi:hypothetical protein